MGYRSVMNGEITITPRISFKELRALPEDIMKTGYYRSIRFDIQGEETTTDEGVLTTKYVEKLLPQYDDEFKAYGVVGDLQVIADMLPEHTLEGYFEIEGEDMRDVWRMTVINGYADKIYPTLQWPVETGWGSENLGAMFG